MFLRICTCLMGGNGPFTGYEFPLSQRQRMSRSAAMTR